MIKKWLKKMLGITELEGYNKELLALYHHTESELETLKSEIHKMDRVDIDISPHQRGQNTIVLTGCYKGKGYVQFYDVPHDEFAHYVERLQYEKKSNLIRNVDCPPNVRAYFNFK